MTKPSLLKILEKEQEMVSAILEAIEDLGATATRQKTAWLGELLHWLEHSLGAQAEVILPFLPGGENLAKQMYEVEREGNGLQSVSPRSAKWHERFQEFLAALELYQASLVDSVRRGRGPRHRLGPSRLWGEKYLLAQSSPCKSEHLGRAARA